MLAAAALAMTCPAPAQEPSVPANTRFVMSYFKANNGGGDERLFISVSPDGQNWTALNGGQAVWQHPNYPNYVVRDPTIVFHKGFYWVAHTSGRYGVHPERPSFGLLKSKDLINWTQVGEINTSIPNMVDPFTWNPCFFKDGDGSLHVFVSISRINANNSTYPIPDLRTYELHPLNDDLTEWSAPTVVQLPHSNTNEFWAWKDGETYHAVYVSFNSNGNLVHATSKSLLTGWGNERVFGFATEEGLFVLKKPDGNYRLYTETGNGTATGYMWRDTNPEFSVFTQAAMTTTDTPMRNGKPAAIAGFLSYDAWRADRMGGLPIIDSERLADPDYDGQNNFLEYALDLNPRERSPAALTLSGNGATGLTARWRQAPSRKDAQVALQRTPDLGSWNLSAGFVVQSVALMIDGSEEVTAIHAAAASQERSNFVRLRVTDPGIAQIALPPAIAANSQTASSAVSSRAAKQKRSRGR